VVAQAGCDREDPGHERDQDDALHQAFPFEQSAPGLLADLEQADPEGEDNAADKCPARQWVPDRVAAEAPVEDEAAEGRAREAST
jgi:hypothetical protein